MDDIVLEKFKAYKAEHDGDFNDFAFLMFLDVLYRVLATAFIIFGATSFYFLFKQIFTAGGVS